MRPNWITLLTTYLNSNARWRRERNHISNLHSSNETDNVEGRVIHASINKVYAQHQLIIRFFDQDVLVGSIFYTANGRSNVMVVIPSLTNAKFNRVIERLGLIVSRPGIYHLRHNDASGVSNARLPTGLLR